MLPALLAALLAVQPARPFNEQRLLLDRRLETLRRILPDGPTASADVLVVRDLAESARLARVEIQPRPPVESGSRGEVALDVSALGGYEETFRFFERVALSHRLVDVESLTLTATTEDVIQVGAVLRFPYWPARAPLPPPPESPRGRPTGVPRPTLDAFLRDQEPMAWNQWPEIVWHERRAPKFIGDLPHTWVGSDFARSFLDLFAYEREEDSSLVVGAGLPERWVRSERGVSVKGLGTPYGPLDISLAAAGAGVRVRLSGLRELPPGGLVVRPPLPANPRTATVDGRPLPLSPAGDVVVHTLPAEVVVQP